VSGRDGSYGDGEASRSGAVDEAIDQTVDQAVDAAVMAAAVTGGRRAANAGGPPARRPKARRLRIRSRRWLAVLLLGSMLGIVGALAWALLGSRFFSVRSVVVTGTHLVPPAEVLAVADVKPGTPLIRVNTARIAARVLTIRQVRSVHVSASWPDRVIIAVQERISALAVALPGGGFDLIDSDGVVVRSAATRPRRFPLYNTTAAVSSLAGNPDVGAAAAVLGELPPSLRSSVSSVAAPSPDQVTLQLRSGVTILWGGADDAAAKAEEIAVLLPTHAHYYDVSSPTTAVTN
jgi:cell division protein FtsQ